MSFGSQASVPFLFPSPHDGGTYDAPQLCAVPVLVRIHCHEYLCVVPLRVSVNPVAVHAPQYPVFIGSRRVLPEYASEHCGVSFPTILHVVEHPEAAFPFAVPRSHCSHFSVSRIPFPHDGDVHPLHTVMV